MTCGLKNYAIVGQLKKKIILNEVFKNKMHWNFPI